jgi:hypothetical protein
VVLLLAVGLLKTGWPGSGGGTGDAAAAPPSGSKAAAAASVKAAVSPAAPVNPALDQCLVGTWRMTSMQIVNHFEGVDARFTSPGGLVTRIWPDGRAVDDYSKLVPLTSTIKGYKYVETLRGTVTSHNETRGGHLYSSEFAGGPSYKVTRNGRTQKIEVHVTASTDLPYICSETRLTTYGNEKHSTQSFVRVSKTP